jgi:hypothetical protein
MALTTGRFGCAFARRLMHSAELTSNSNIRFTYVDAGTTSADFSLRCIIFPIGPPAGHDPSLLEGLVGGYTTCVNIPVQRLTPLCGCMSV